MNLHCSRFMASSFDKEKVMRKWKYGNEMLSLFEISVISGNNLRTLRNKVTANQDITAEELMKPTQKYTIKNRRKQQIGRSTFNDRVELPALDQDLPYKNLLISQLRERGAEWVASHFQVRLI